MKILVTARYITGEAREGGSGRFYATAIRALRHEGHEVIASTDPSGIASENYDLIICSHHETWDAIKDNPARKIYISHGLIKDEAPTLGADRYIYVSEEARNFHQRLSGIDGDVIGQPITIYQRVRPGDELKKILIIRKTDPDPDPFAFLTEKYDVAVSDPDTPIEDQIDWADLVISIGRGCLEAMAQGKPVLVADSRPYIGAYGDGYLTWENIQEIARCNFSGRRYWHPLTREWIEGELAKYSPVESLILHKYVTQNHEAGKIVNRYLEDIEGPGVVYIRDMSEAKIGFGCISNDPLRLDMVLKQSEFPPDVLCRIMKNPVSATKGLNALMDWLERDGNEIAVLTHQDMYYRQGWIDQVRDQLSRLPDNWIVAGIIGKDAEGLICGKFHDMRIPLIFNTEHLHSFPHPACCFDECCIIVNLKSGFRFDESYEGFDLYGTLAVLQAWEMGGTAWIIDAFAEHYCMRPFTWHPDQLFIDNFKRLYDRFKSLGRLDSTAIGLSKEDLTFSVSAS